LQRAELFDDEEPQDDAGSAGPEEVLQPVPQAYVAQRSEVIGRSGRVIGDLKITRSPDHPINDHPMRTGA
jgi:hypothetical protein